ncbi:MAG: hypothetical protein AAF456_04325 [Planctomycetota bacterium]
MSDALTVCENSAPEAVSRQPESTGNRPVVRFRRLVDPGNRTKKATVCRSLLLIELCEVRSAYDLHKFDPDGI